MFVELKAARCLSSCQFLFGRNLVYENKLSKLAKLVLHTNQGVLSQMTDVPDNPRPRWPNFKQSEEVYNIMVFFNTSEFTVEVKN